MMWVSSGKGKSTIRGDHAAKFNSNCDFIDIHFRLNGNKICIGVLRKDIEKFINRDFKEMDTLLNFDEPADADTLLAMFKNSMEYLAT